MRKKIFLLLMFLVSFMGFSLEARAVDYSLLYDVTSFDISETEIRIKGFAVRHNFHNDNPKINIFFEDSSGNKVVDFDVSKTNDSLSDWYCQRNIDNTCNKYSSYRYDGVVFDAKLNLSDFSNSSVFKYNTNYTLKIQVCLKNDGCSIVEELGVPKGVVSGENKDIEITNSTDMMTIYTSSSRLLSSNWGYGTIQDGGVFWEQKSSYKILSVIKGGSSCTSGATKYSYCPNLYELSYGYIYEYGTKYGCVKNGIRGYASIGNQCSAYASAAWVKPNGNVTISFKNKDDKPDEVCINEDKSINSCSSANLSYNCDKMKIKTTSNGASDGTVLTAYVKINEYGRFTMTSSVGGNVEVIAGQGFPIGMSYIYNLSWEMSDIVCNGIADDICKEKLNVYLQKMSFDDVKANKLESSLNNAGQGVSSNITFDDNTDGNLSSAGSWECNGGLNDVSKTSGGATIICQYKIKDAYINFDTGYITYKDKRGQDRFKNLGSYFYIPLNYSDPTFSWNVVSDNISLVKVRTVKENYSLSTSHNWNINTDGSLDDSGNVKSGCYINVEKGPFGPPDDSVPGDGINIVYRSVDTDISSDESTLDSNLKLYYLEEGTNWYNYFYNVNDDDSKSLNRSHISRIKTTFNNLHYSTKTLTNSKIKSLLKDYDSESYINWKNVDSNGISKFINSDYFDIIKNQSDIHCKWGEFDEAACDKYNS